MYGHDKTARYHYFKRFPHLEHRRWYSFTWKNIGFIMVDSNFSTLTDEESRQQIQWYLGELEKFDRDERLDHIIVCCHEPPFTNSRIIFQIRSPKFTLPSHSFVSRKPVSFSADTVTPMNVSRMEGNPSSLRAEAVAQGTKFSMIPQSGVTETCSQAENFVSFTFAR
jgi:hypothetical protein